MKKFDHKDILELPDRYRAKLINSLSGFKSANLVGTKLDNHTNLSIVNSAVHLGATPPLMGLIFRPDTVERHTLNNLRKTQYCTLNHVNTNFYEQAHQTSARFPKLTSEFEACELTEEYLSSVDVPFVKESNIKMLLKYVREEKIHENGTHFVILSIEEVHLNEDLIHEDGYVDIEKAQTACISALDGYHSTNRLARLSYAKPDKLPEKI